MKGVVRAHMCIQKQDCFKIAFFICFPTSILDCVVFASQQEANKTIWEKNRKTKQGKFPVVFSCLGLSWVKVNANSQLVDEEDLEW